MRRFLICALAIVAVVSCKKDDSQSQSGGDSIVGFKTSNTITRTTEIEKDGVMVDAWESGDRVGITTIGFSADYANVEYQASTSSDAATTSFAVVDADQAICYPAGESGEVAFYGYYPYTSLYEDGIITASVADQAGDIGAVDFMIASSSVSYSSGASSEDVSLEFNHALSKVIFN